MAMVSLQSASVEDSCVGAMRLLAHLPLHDAIEAVRLTPLRLGQAYAQNAEAERIVGDSDKAAG